MNKALNIGTKVVNSYGETGKIVDRMYSEKEKEFYYGVNYDSRDVDEILLAKGNELRELSKENGENYEAEINLLNNVCVAIIYRKENGGKKEVCRGHGHIIHEGDIGVAQALSYAFKKAYEKLNNGNLLKKEI